MNSTKRRTKWSNTGGMAVPMTRPRGEMLGFQQAVAQDARIERIAAVERHQRLDQPLEARGVRGGRRVEPAFRGSLESFPECLEDAAQQRLFVGEVVKDRRLGEPVRSATVAKLMPL
jgi:hypothetical protein